MTKNCIEILSGFSKIFIILICCILIIPTFGFFNFYNNDLFCSTAAAAPETRATNIAGQHITTNTTWTSAGSPYMIKGDVYINHRAALTLEPGTTLKFEGKFSIYVNGTLNASGTNANWITVTSKAQSAPGEWNSIYVNSTGLLILRFAELSYGLKNLILDGASKNVIENVKIFRSKQWGVELDHSSNNIITNSSFYLNTWSGLFLDASSNNKIINCSFNNNSYDGYTSDYSSNNLLENCTFMDNTLEGIHIFKANNIRIMNCTTNNNDNGLIFGSSDLGIVTNLITKYNKDYGAYFHYSDNNDIKESYFMNNKHGIGLYNSTYNTIAGAVILTNTILGIELEDSSNNHIKDGSVAYHGSVGFYVRKGQAEIGSNNNKIEGTEIFENINGMYILYSSSTQASDLHVHDNINGLFLFEASNSNVNNVNVSDNDNAVRVWRSSGVKVTNSLIKDNIIGIFMGSGTKSNTVHHNYILNNTINGGDSDVGNIWDDQMGEGNYWSDYNGTDYDENGIGDQPHPVTNFSEDRWPLVDIHNTVLKVHSTNPENDQTQVPMNTNVEITFSEKMVTSSVSGKIDFTPDVDIISSTWSDFDRTVTFQIPELTNGTTYYVDIDNTSIKSILGKPLRYPYQFSFTTEDPYYNRRPFVVDHLPKGDNVTLNSTIYITFNEPMYKPSLLNATEISPSIDFEFGWKNDTTVLLDPISNLSLSTKYNITINTNASNLVGNGMLDNHSFEFTTESDILPPYVIDFFPAGIEPVPVETQLVILMFNEDVDTTSVEDRFSILPHSNGTFDWPDKNRTFYYKFASNLLYNTTYSVKLSPGFSDILGNFASELFEFSFTTVAPEVNDTDPDLNPPYVIDYFPKSTEPISVETEMVILMFNETVNTSSVETRFEIFPESAGKFEWETNNHTVYYRFDSNLLYDTNYIVRLLPGYTDTAGNPNLEEFEFSFITVAGAVLFKIMDYSPSGDSVPVDSEIEITFNRAANHSSVEGAFEINPSVPGKFRWEDTTLIFQPDENLTYNETYTISIAITAVDMYGNPLNKTFSWQFKTQAFNTSEGPDNNIKPDPDETDDKPDDQKDDGDKSTDDKGMTAGITAVIIMVIIIILIAILTIFKRKKEEDIKEEDEEE